MTIHDVEQAFVKKLGAEKDKSGDHIYFYYLHKGDEYTVGKLSHSWRGDLNDTQVGMLAHKLLLQKTEFERFVDCSLDTPKLIETWQARKAATAKPSKSSS